MRVSSSNNLVLNVSYRGADTLTPLLTLSSLTLTGLLALRVSSTMASAAWNSEVKLCWMNRAVWCSSPRSSAAGEDRRAWDVEGRAWGVEGRAWDVEGRAWDVEGRAWGLVDTIWGRIVTSDGREERRVCVSSNACGTSLQTKFFVLKRLQMLVYGDCQLI